ncbi:MAG: type II and III secretion system protein [Pseudobdellovibrio sp.]|nr:type II and III secretion system protein [Pseudobdellovibrio sp.]
MLKKSVGLRLIFILCFAFQFVNAQSSAPSSSSTPEEKPVYEETEEGGGTNVKLLKGEPNKRRIRRQLNLIAGVKHDEEISIPEIPLTYKGNVELLDIQRIKGTDTFRMFATKPDAANGIITIHNKKTGQVLVELRVDIRPQSIEKTLRELQALLADIEGIEYKIVNNRIVLDGFVLLPKDLKRIGQVIGQFKEGGTQIVSSLVSLSPIAKKKIVEYIARDINNPEITVSSIGDFIKLEGYVNSIEEKNRINDIVLLYLPDIVTERGQENLLNLQMSDRKAQTDINNYVINLIQVRRAEEKTEPPPKMIQVVMHVVEYAERYMKSFNFTFSPSLRGLGEAQTQGQANAPGSISELAAVVDNLLPKLNWARTHGYIRLLDTASILTQDKTEESGLSRTFNVNNGTTSTTNPQSANAQTFTLSLSVLKPQIKSERSELVQMGLKVKTVAAPGGQQGLMFSADTNVATMVSVRSRQSAAIAGIISKKSENQFGGPTGAGAVITLNHGKGFTKNSSNYVLFITPIIKSSASAGVEQVKKKFRFKD